MVKVLEGAEGGGVVLVAAGRLLNEKTGQSLIITSWDGWHTDSLSRLLLFRGPVLKTHSRFEMEHLREVWIDQQAHYTLNQVASSSLVPSADV